MNSTNLKKTSLLQTVYNATWYSYNRIRKTKWLGFGLENPITAKCQAAK
jgi:hypothetical protein